MSALNFILSEISSNENAHLFGDAQDPAQGRKKNARKFSTVAGRRKTGVKFRRSLR